VKPRPSPGLRPELLPVDFVKTRSECSFALTCSENCCALQGQHSEVPLCNVNILERLGLALLRDSLDLGSLPLLNFPVPPAAAVGILGSAVASSCFTSCHMTAQTLEKSQSPCRVLFIVSR